MFLSVLLTLIDKGGRPNLPRNNAVTSLALARSVSLTAAEVVEVDGYPTNRGFFCDGGLFCDDCGDRTRF